MKFDVALAVAWLGRFADAVDAHRDQLTQLDSAIGDGDHGSNMQRGCAAVRTALADAVPATVGTVLVKAGGTLISKVGGASGPLYGSALRAAGKALGDGESASAEQLVEALNVAIAALAKLGAAQPGDKTMLDAWTPAVAALGEAVTGGDGLASAARAAAEAAEQGAAATVPLQARKGRASYLGPRSIGHRDPGASSTVLLFAALAEVTRDAPGATRDAPGAAG